MKIVADTHVHLYSCYDLNVAFNTLRNNLNKISTNATCLAFLAERHDCHYFSEIINKGASFISPEIQVDRFNNSVCLKEKGYPDLFLFAGRQIITSERIEILALTIDESIPDGLPAQKVIETVVDHGGIPVLSWAPGKWFGGRGELIENLITTGSSRDMVLGDTTLRPWCWGEPKKMEKAVRNGYAVLAGSDPLPFAGEEKKMGKYVSTWDSDFDLSDPVGSVRSLMKTGDWKPARAGKRGKILETLFRLYYNSQSKKI